MSVVITYGTFDLYHVGHVRLFKRLRHLADRVVVGVSTDPFNKRKGKRALYSFEQRMELVSSCVYVDSVFPEETWDQKEADIRREKATLFVMGDDWEGEFDYLKESMGIDVLYLKRTEKISTSLIKNKILNLSGLGLQ